MRRNIFVLSATCMISLFVHAEDVSVVTNGAQSLPTVSAVDFDIVSCG